jgi:hypothetical protein
MLDKYLPFTDYRLPLTAYYWLLDSLIRDLRIFVPYSLVPLHGP